MVTHTEKSSRAAALFLCKEKFAPILVKQQFEFYSKKILKSFPDTGSSYGLLPS